MSYLFGRWQLSSNFGFVVQAMFKGCNKLQHSAHRTNKKTGQFLLGFWLWQNSTVIIWPSKQFIQEIWWYNWKSNQASWYILIEAFENDVITMYLKGIWFYASIQKTTKIFHRGVDTTRLRSSNTIRVSYETLVPIKKSSLSTRLNWPLRFAVSHKGLKLPKRFTNLPLWSMSLFFN